MVELRSEAMRGRRLVSSGVVTRWDKSSFGLENPERRRGQCNGFVGGIAGVVGEVGIPLGEHLERGKKSMGKCAGRLSCFGAFPVERRSAARRWSARRSME